MKFQSSICLSLLLSIIATPLYADSGRDEVFEQLALLNLINGLDDYEPVVEPLLLLLDEDESETTDIYMQKNHQYVISVVCDDDCDDVDVWLYDDKGRLIDSDTDSDDTAVIRGRPKNSGTYSVQIRVSDCDREPCHVGAQAFRR